MELDYSLPNLLILLGAIQGFIFSSILLIKKKHKANLFLAIFMLTLSYNAFETFSAVSGLGDHIVFFDLFSYTAIFLLGLSLLLLRSIYTFSKKEYFKRLVKASLWTSSISVLCKPNPIHHIHFKQYTSHSGGLENHAVLWFFRCL